MSTLRIKLAPGASAPTYATDGASGMDLRALETWTLQPGSRARIPTGVSLEIPPGYEAQVRPRSGLSSQGIDVALGTVDQDFRGFVQVMLVNNSTLPRVVHSGDRIAQLVIAPVARVEVQVVDELSETERGVRGFGSTGTR